MMQMLRAGGMSVVCDEQRQADLNNPQGYFESACLPGFLRSQSHSKACKAGR